MRNAYTDKNYRQEILESGKHPLSVKSKKEIIGFLQRVFAVPKVRIRNQGRVRAAGWGLPKARYHHLIEPLTSPFEKYTFAWNDWHAFAKDLCAVMRNKMISNLGYYQEMRNDLGRTSINEKAISTRVFAEWEACICDYIAILESLICSLLHSLHIADKNGDDESEKEDLFLEVYRQKSGEADQLLTHSIFNLFGVGKDFHTFFLEYIWYHIVEEKDDAILRNKNEVQRLSAQVASLKELNKKSTASLKEVVKQQVHQQTHPSEVRNTSWSPDNADLVAENKRLMGILQALWYDAKEARSPKEWLSEREKDAIEGQSFEWELIAFEEAEEAKRLRERLSKQGGYIALLEEQLRRVPESLAKQHREERWNAGKMKMDEMMLYLSENPTVAEEVSPLIIESIEQLTPRIGGSSLSSTNGNDVWTGSGHMSNIVIAPLLNFIKDNLRNGQYECLAISWKGLISSYIDSANWRPSEGSHSTFSLLLKHLPDEPGNLTNIESLTVWMRAIEKTFGVDLRGLCERISELFWERMTVLQRRIFTETSRKAELEFSEQ